MRRTKKVYEEIRLKVVREALSGIKIAVLGRKYELHPETIRGWIRDYQDEIGEDQIPSTDEQIQELKRLQEIEDKYHKAIKILGEKELENEILRELVKKQNPAYLKNLK
ncbi:transposase [Paenibacillus albiflavus]|nr:helix-turn-helix domain-containing protein [Paenibacillus albiflavus]TCZ72883.1 transposase [Paenibacillus albiflavus]TCZ76784.1 transposase [Paenibacillus albiflavus]TCZ78713.1 transposase [Paenibacillus albiflavus]